MFEEREMLFVLCKAARVLENGIRKWKHNRVQDKMDGCHTVMKLIQLQTTQVTQDLTVLILHNKIMMHKLESLIAT